MPKKKFFYGWWLVLASAILQFYSAGTFNYGFTTFFNPIRNTFGWSAAATSVAFTLQRLESGILGPIAGFVADRIGPRKLMLAGWAVVGLGFLWMSRINSLWAFYGSFLLLASGMSLASGLMIQIVIANWFNKKRSRALTFMLLGPGVGGLLVPLLAFSITSLGWRETLTIVGIGAWVIGLPLSSLMRHKPRQYGYLPDGETTTTNEPAGVTDLVPSGKTRRASAASPAVDFTAKAALRTSTFWLLALVAFFQHIGQSAVMIHIVPYLESVGMPTTIAASGVTAMTLFSLIGRLGFGFLGDFANKRYLIATAMALQAIGLFVFSFVGVDKVWLLILFLLTYGSGYGGPLPLKSALQADYFGARHFGTIMGLMSLITMGGGLASPIIAGWFFDTMGSYRPAWQLFALVTLPAIPLILLVKPPKQFQSHRFS